MKKFALTFLIVVCAIPFAYAKQYGFKDLVISDIWARPTVGKEENSAIYLTIKNEGLKNDVLIKAETGVAKNIEIHKTIDNNGISSMVHINKVAIPAKSKVSFVPGGLHIMLIGVTKELSVGEKFPLSLTFENAGRINVEVVVESNKK